MSAAQRTPENSAVSSDPQPVPDHVEEPSRRRRPVSRRILAGAGILSVTLTLAASAPGSGQEGVESAGEADEEAADQDEADGEAEGEGGEGVLNPHFTENEVFSWNLPEGWAAENEITHEEPWPNNEFEQSVEFYDAEDETAATASVNIATDNDGPPPADTELVEAELIPTAEQPLSETYVRSALVSDCTEADSVGDPQSECGYFISFSLVSLEEGQDIEDTQNVWAFHHEIEGEDHGGNVLMSARLPADVAAEDQKGATTLEGVPYEEAQELVDSEEYQDLWDLFSSFGHHPEGSAQ